MRPAVVVVVVAPYLTHKLHHSVLLLAFEDKCFRREKNPASPTILLEWFDIYYHERHNFSIYYMKLFITFAFFNIVVPLVHFFAREGLLLHIIQQQRRSYQYYHFRTLLKLLLRYAASSSLNKIPFGFRNKCVEWKSHIWTIRSWMHVINGRTRFESDWKESY